MRMKFAWWVLIGMIIGGFALLTPNDPSTDATPTPYTSETADPWPTDTAPAVDAFWDNGVTANDTFVDTCTEYDLCTIVEVAVHKNCSAITLYGSTYDANENEIDAVEQDLPAAKAGSQLTVSFGTDAFGDEEYVELDDATCWK